MTRLVRAAAGSTHRRAISCIAFAALAASVACGGETPGARNVTPSSADLVTPFAAAFAEEAKGDPASATRAYLDTLDAAAASPANPWQLVVAEATLDALVLRAVSSFSGVTEDSALAFRTKDPSPIHERLPGIQAKAHDPFVPGLVARALERMARHRGDAALAEKWREATGCAREATVIGPLAWAPVTGVDEPDPLEKFDATIAAAYAGPGAFAMKEAPVVVRGRGCAFDLSAESANPGVRDVVVDVDVPRAQRIGVALRAHGAALLRAGGVVVVRRAYELGGGEAARFGTLDAERGKLRLVARVGMDEDGESVEIGAWDERGAPLMMHAPRAGEAATARGSHPTALGYPSPKTDAERLALAAGALAAGDGRVAEYGVLEATRPNARTDLSLVYARALETARDLSLVHRSERSRAAYEKVIEAWPSSWEAILAHAVLAGVRRGQTEARIETLADLDEHRAKAGPFALPILDAFDAAISGKDQLLDRARAAEGRARAALGPASLVHEAGRFATDRTGAERAAYACAPEPPNDRASLGCYDALHALGDLPLAARELQRLRALAGAPDAYLALSLRDALALGDAAAANRALADMLPGERTLGALYGVAKLGGKTVPAADLRAAMLTARDAPASLPPLLRATGDDPTAPFEGIAEKLAEEDRAHPILANAATAVLTHTERYDVDASGITSVVLYDLRRVSGTTDVEENAQAAPPDLAGRTTLRVLRRRIFKKDGRVLEPDRTPRASQSHADLSQLEAGDIVEAIYEGWSLPTESGDVGIDTPDMLPERTGVHDATIELRLPKSVKGALYSHPLLGKARETEEGGRRVLVWTMKDHPVRRIEEGTPKMDRSVAVSFATMKWDDVARGLREALASLDDENPEVAAWARASAGHAKEPSEVVAAVVEAAGSAVKEASPGLLTDIGLGHASGPQTSTARGILTSREGSRTWLIVRALRELGIKSEVVIAENDPFSADPSFPPHIGRFMHPLAVATVREGATERAVWIDADVPGPPLPAGRISPELRGRSAVHADGSIVPILGAGAGEERDEVDVRLVVDAKGNAKGKFTILLRGRDAQEIAEALVRIVGDERQRALRGVALAWVPFADVEDVALSSSEGSWQIALRADLTIPAYAQVEGAGPPATRTWTLPGIDPLHTVFPRAGTSTLGASYASQGSRENALAVSQAVQYHAHRRVELPAGATITRMPGPFEVKSPNLEASRKISVSGTVIEDDFILGVPTGTVPADRYGAFVKDAHHTDDAFLASTRAKPPK